MSRCEAELCLNWTGNGCVCAVFDRDPVIVEPNDYKIFTAEDAEPETVNRCPRHSEADWDLCDMGCATEDDE